MAKLESLICKGCGSPIGLEQLDACPYCSSQNFIKGSVDPLTMEGQKMQDLISFYKTKIASNPTDTNSLFALGLFYLNMKNYRFAQQNFLKAVEQSPMDPDVYYYYALSLMAGRAPKNLDNNEAIEIEEQIHTAVRMQRKRKYLALLAFIEQGAFISNGLQAKANPAELINEAVKIMPEAGELEEIETHAQPTDKQNMAFLAQLRSGKQSTGNEHVKRYRLSAYQCPACGSHNLSNAGEFIECDDCGNHIFMDNGFYESLICAYPNTRDYEITPGGCRVLEDESERQSFFQHLWEPNKPKHEDMPFLPIWRVIKDFIWAIILFFVVAIVCSVTNFDEGVEQKHVFEKVNKKRPNMEQLAADSAFLADYYISSYRMLDSDGDYVGKKIKGKPDETVARPYEVTGVNLFAPKTLLYLLVLASPFLLWLLIAVIRFSARIKERRAIRARNRAADEYYQQELQIHNTRPTIQDYVLFCMNFLGQDINPKGDIVSKIMDKLDISERNLAGKILFLNYFDAYQGTDKWEGRYTNPNQVLDRIYYVIAIPEKDQLQIVRNYWDTVSDYMSEPEVTTLFYGNITQVNVNKDEDKMIIQTSGGEEYIELPTYGRENILHYQDKFPQSNGGDFSITRTGDVMEFRNAINTLIRTYQK